MKSGLAELDELRGLLNREITRPSRWMGSLRRLVKATSIQQSTSIEGFRVSVDDAVAIVNHDIRGELATDSERAVSCYSQAMDHVVVLARDPEFQWSSRVILDLHFETCYFQENIGAGLWRTGPVSITGPDGKVVYEAPEAKKVPLLMKELVKWLQSGDPDSHVIVRAAMAHLNAVSIHPFRDGNGRVSRILQSLVLAKDGLLAPEFSSIEEYLGMHTQDYYSVLQETHGPTYQPERDATGWVAFCIEAHLAQAKERLMQIRSAAKRWEQIEMLVGERNWPERFIIALEQSLVGGINRRTYATEAEISPATASADLQRLLDSGLVEQHGKGPVTRYHATKQLLQCCNN